MASAVDLGIQSLTPAAYGRACVACSRAKVRCLYRRDSSSCERCHRLKKDADCRPPTPVRRRNARPRVEVRTAQLEEKLDDLVSLLRSQASSKGVPPGSLAASEHNGGPSKSTANALLSQTNTLLSPPATVNNGTVLNPSTAASSPAATPSFAHPISAEDAEQCLDLFRTVLLPFLPFYRITTSAQQLGQDRPIFWLSILSLTVKSLVKQTELSEQLRQIIAQRVILGSDRSVDLLLAMITHIAWSHFHNRSKPYLTVWVNILVAMAFDLGLNRVHNADYGNCTRPVWNVILKTMPAARERTAEERRAVLGVFLLNSGIASRLRKGETMQFTPQMENSLQLLSERPECEEDIVLAAQVRCQLVLEQVSRSPWSSGFTGLLAEEQDPEVAHSPPPAYVKALQTQLQEIQRTLPEKSRDNTFIHLFLLSTELAIIESVLYREPVLASGAPDLAVVESLHAVLRTAASWLSTCFSLPPLLFHGFTFAIFMQSYEVITCLFRLTALRSPAWDRAAVRATADVFAVIDRFADRFEDAPGLAGLLVDDENVHGDVAPRRGRIMRAMRASLEGELATLDAQAQAQEQVEDGGRSQLRQSQPQQVEPQQPPLGNMVAFDQAVGGAVQGKMPIALGDAWWTDIFGPWESAF